MLPKCPICNKNFITAKSRQFARQEGVDENICLYCLADKTGKVIGRYGMVDATDTSPEASPSYNSVTTPSYKRQVASCRPCLQRRVGR